MKRSFAAAAVLAILGGASQSASLIERSAPQAVNVAPTGRSRNTPNRRAPGAGMASIRAARKARNVRRHRAACR